MSKGINGIPIKLLVASETGDDIETAYFATARKCPAVKAAIRSLVDIENEHRRLQRRMEIIDRQINSCDELDVLDKLSESRRECSTKLIDMVDQMDSARQELVTAGFTGAGYDGATVARLTAAVPPERFHSLLLTAQVGGGALDFTVAATA